MHVSIGGKGVAAEFAMERPLSTVDQHVAIQAGTRAEHFVADPASESLFARLVLSLIVVRADVQREVVLRCQHLVADGTHVFPFGRATIAAIVAVTGLDGRVGCGREYSRIGAVALVV